MALDLIIKNGHVIDTTIGLDGIHTIGIKGDKIVSVNEGALNAIDATGCLVFPGLIDFVTHGSNPPIKSLYY